METAEEENGISQFQIVRVCMWRGRVGKERDTRRWEKVCGLIVSARIDTPCVMVVGSVRDNHTIN